ncbi:MAG: hypothetical protein DRP06_00625 [Candidatus Aenigmatarchaeota archaeon]|nr:MAG: hypothetical protein DRP06_00625 [Candidatus Aenigmarchaeota archaeon]
MDGFLNGLQREKELNSMDEKAEPIKLIEPFPISIDTSDQIYRDLVKHEIKDILEMMKYRGYVLKEMESDNGSLRYSVNGLYDITLESDSSSINYEIKFDDWRDGAGQSRIVSELIGLNNLINYREKKPTEMLIGNNWDQIEIVDWEIGDGREEAEEN